MTADAAGSGSSDLPQPVPWVEQMAPYAAPEDPRSIARRAGVDPEELIKLDANENPYGPSPRVREALATFNGYELYPDPEQKTIRPLVAEYAGVQADQLMLGNGSDELIDLICRIYLRTDDETIDCTPTFGMYRFSTELCGGRVVEAPRNDSWGIDVAAVEAALTARTKLIFVAAPNNPSGTVESEETVRALLATRRIVILDEAYIEFADQPSLARLVAEHDNLVVLRTFSKWSGLAGLRVGYGVFPPAMLAQLWKVKPPFNVNLAAEIAVAATLEDLSHARQAIELIVQERERMSFALAAVAGISVWKSSANFVLLRVGEPGAASLRDFLVSQGIAIRTYSHPRLADTIRISVGRPEQTDAVAAAVWNWREMASMAANDD